ncbi:MULTISPECIES: GNAT family N-acetyltransferase [unclassified Meiothermus]|uniref:GNAT family N-acetyltransferase n=1 Tax=unclassified Meiothermus TaxID=370471 RepID=UPI001F179E99|nr:MULTISPECIES: N-acetyltransferase [unclassified Meiothermus]
MATPRRSLTIRPARPSDLEALGQIAYATGFFGDSAAVYFPSPPLFRDLWIKPYLNGVGACNFVAELEGEIVGYIVGAPDERAYQRYFLRSAWEILRKILSGGYPGLLKSALYLLRAARYGSRQAPIERYPAHLHINLLPQARGLGAGQKLLEAHLDCLRARGIAGVQLSTTQENQAALGLYRKLGFEVYIQWQSPLWKPWLGREAVHLVMVKDLS